MPELRQFYQIYRDAATFAKLFDLKKEVYVGELPTYARIYAAILNVLASESVFRGIEIQNHQIRILMENGIEVKVTNVNGYWRKAFIQVSSPNMFQSAQILDSILKEVKELEEADKQ